MFCKWRHMASSGSLWLIHIKIVQFPASEYICTTTDGHDSMLLVVVRSRSEQHQSAWNLQGLQLGHVHVTIVKELHCLSSFFPYRISNTRAVTNKLLSSEPGKIIRSCFIASMAEPLEATSPVFGCMAVDAPGVFILGMSWTFDWWWDPDAAFVFSPFWSGTASELSANADGSCSLLLIVEVVVEVVVVVEVEVKVGLNSGCTQPDLSHSHPSGQQPPLRVLEHSNMPGKHLGGWAAVDLQPRPVALQQNIPDVVYFVRWQAIVTGQQISCVGFQSFSL